MDEIDRALLAVLQVDGTLTYAELGERVGLSISATNERLKRLRARGLLTGVVGVVSPRAVGLDVCAFVHVLVDRPEHNVGFLAAVDDLPAVQECHHVTGNYSYLLKVRVRDTAALEAFLSDELKRLPGVSRSHTAIALSSPKETTALDLGAIPTTRRERS